MRRLQGRDGVLVDELDMSATFEDQAELVETGNRTLEHHAVDQEERHSLMLPRRGTKELVLELRFRAVRRRSRGHQVRRRIGRHDRRDRMLVDELRCALAPKQ